MGSAPFAPVIRGISAAEAPEVPGLEAVISYWTEREYTAEEWFGELAGTWGSAGLVARRGDEVLGFAVFGPAGYLPRAGHYPVGDLEEDDVLLACVEGDGRTSRNLLVRVLRELRVRGGVSGIEAIASDLGSSRHVSTRFLVENGWQPLRRVWYRCRPYTLVRVDLNSAVWTEDAAQPLGGVARLPRLKGAPRPSPGIFVRPEPPERVKTAGPRS